MTTDRRSFVKGVVLGAAAGAAGATGVAAWRWSVGSPVVPGPLRYAAARVLPGSPAPRGVPLVPLRIDAQGFVRVAVDDLRPFTYCGRRADAEEASAAADDYARFHVAAHKLEQLDEQQGRERYWYFERLGERIHVDDFRDRPHGDGASFIWRDEGAQQPFVAVLIKLRPEEVAADDEHAAGALGAARVADHDLVAFDSACTHFCCIAGWREDPSAERLGMWDLIFCTCHNARFDPRQVTMYEFESRTD